MAKLLSFEFENDENKKVGNRIRRFLFYTQYKKPGIFALILLLLAFPIVMFALSQRQDNRQRATVDPVQVSQSWFSSQNASSPGFNVVPAETNVPKSILVDSRFGIDGECTTSLDISWNQQWGHGADFPNQSEYNCRARGIKTFFTVAKLDNNETYTGQWPNLPWFVPTIDPALRDEAFSVFDRMASGRILDNAKVSFNYLPYYTLFGSGSVFKIANEPDWAQGPYFTPDDYAIVFHAYATQIKRLDPTAKVMVGGLVASVNHPGDWMCQDGYAPQSEINCNGSSGNRYNWIRVFRESYRNRYGSYPPVDIWGIHPYTWADRYYQDRDNAWFDAKDKIVAFKDFLDSIDEGGKEIWIPEFSLGIPAGSINADRAQEAQEVAD